MTVRMTPREIVNRAIALDELAKELGVVVVSAGKFEQRIEEVTVSMQVIKPAIIEQSNDKDGIIWPLSVAPFQACITPLGVVPGSAVMMLAERLYNELTARDAISVKNREQPVPLFEVQWQKATGT